MLLKFAAMQPGWISWMDIFSMCVLTVTKAFRATFADRTVHLAGWQSVWQQSTATMLKWVQPRGAKI